MNTEAFAHNVYCHNGSLLSKRSNHEDRQKRAKTLLNIPNAILDMFTNKRVDLNSTSIQDRLSKQSFIKSNKYLDYRPVFVSAKLNLVLKTTYLCQQTPPTRGVVTYFLKPMSNLRAVVVQPLVRLFPDDTGELYHNKVWKTAIVGKEFGYDPHCNNVGEYLGEFVVFDW